MNEVKRGTFPFCSSCYKGINYVYVIRDTNCIALPVLFLTPMTYFMHIIGIYFHRKWLSRSYGLSSLNIELSGLPVPLKMKEMYVENI